jgi:hypothetical protein
MSGVASALVIGVIALAAVAVVGYLLTKRS